MVDSKKGINRHTHSVRSKITPAGRQICPLQQSEAGKVYVPSILYTLRPHALIRSASVGVGVFWAFVAHFG